MSDAYIGTPFGESYFQRHCPVDVEIDDPWMVLFVFRCVGCCQLRDTIQILPHHLLGGIGCSHCIQNGPLACVNLSNYTLNRTSIDFLLASRHTKLTNAARESNHVYVQDLQRLLQHQESAKWIDARVSQRRELLLDRARKLQIPEIALSSLKRRINVYYGPDWHFQGRNLDILLCEYGGFIYKDLIEMLVYNYYYRQTQRDDFLFRVQRSYQSLYNKLLEEETHTSWVGEQLFLPRMRDAMKKGLVALEDMGMCPLKTRVIQNVESWPEFLE